MTYSRNFADMTQGYDGKNQRGWVFLEAGLVGDAPEQFIQNLRDSGELKAFLPEVDALFGVPQVKEYHPEIDTGVHTLMTLKRAVELSDKVSVRYAALVHDLGKALTPQDQWPKHHGHEEAGLAPLEDVNARLGVPDDIAQFAADVTVNHLKCHRALELRPGSIVGMIKDLNGLENPEVLEDFVLANQADKQGRLGFENKPYPQANYLRMSLKALQQYGAKIEGKGLNESAVVQGQVEAVKAIKERFEPQYDVDMCCH